MSERSERDPRAPGHESDDQWMPLPDVTIPPPVPAPTRRTAASGSAFTAPPIDLDAPLPSAPSVTGGSGGTPSPTSPAGSRPSRRWRVPAIVGATALLVVGAVGGGFALARSGDDGGDEGPEATDAPTAEPTNPSPPPDPGVLMAGLAVPGWTDGDSRGAPPFHYICGKWDAGDPDTGSLQAWQRTSGPGAFGSVLVFGSEALVDEYVAEIVRAYTPGCETVFRGLGSDGYRFVWDELSDDDGVVNVAFHVLTPEGRDYYSSGRKMVVGRGPVVVDVNCDSGGPECDDLFQAVIERLEAEVG